MDVDGTPAVEVVIEPRPRDLGGFTVGRLLPAIGRRMVGPFVFLDRMGPAQLDPGHGVDVRPHPHIGLATVTYLFAGAMVHRDSIGSLQEITAGAINWMTAGRGIAHSERSGPEERARGAALDGVQLWVALPAEHEEAAPAFRHHPATSLPTADADGVRLRLLAGSAFGMTAPVEILSPLFYADVELAPGATIELPAEHEERAALIVGGTVSCGARRFAPGELAVFHSQAAGKRPAAVRADSAARLLLLGGAPVGPRHIWWNFVSSSRERIEQAKADWDAGRFGPVTGDALERIPLPAM